MGIARTVLGAVAVAGVARLLAPTETKKIMKTAERTLRVGAKAAKRKAVSVTKAAGVTKSRKRAKTAPKRKMKAAAKSRNAAKRPARLARR
jgi:hypothetical protein